MGGHVSPCQVCFLVAHLLISLEHREAVVQKHTVLSLRYCKKSLQIPSVRPKVAGVARLFWKLLVVLLLPLGGFFTHILLLAKLSFVTAFPVCHLLIFSGGSVS